MKKPYITIKKLKDIGAEHQQFHAADPPLPSTSGCVNCKQPNESATDAKTLYGLSIAELVAIAILVVAVIVFLVSTYRKTHSSKTVFNRRSFPFQPGVI